MSEYTKEQEAAAVEFMAREFSDWKAAVIVTAMAKRTAEAEKEREGMRERARHAEAQRDEAVSLAHESLEESVRAKRLTLEAETQRDALKARVAELERIANDWREERDIAERKLSAPKELPAPPVVVTRELLEMMLADAETRAVYGRGDVPLNPAARLVVAMNAVLEAKP